MFYDLYDDGCLCRIDGNNWWLPCCLFSCRLQSKRFSARFHLAVFSSILTLLKMGEKTKLKWNWVDNVRRFSLRWWDWHEHEHDFNICISFATRGNNSRNHWKRPGSVSVTVLRECRVYFNANLIQLGKPKNKNTILGQLGNRDPSLRSNSYFVHCCSSSYYTLKGSRYCAKFCSSRFYQPVDLSIDKVLMCLYGWTTYSQARVSSTHLIST